MTTREALEHYGGDARALAHVLGIWHSAIYQWDIHPPALRQLQLEHLTNGELKAEPEILRGGRDATDA